MSFEIPTGTRGARQPSGRLVVLMNRLMAGRAGKKGSMMGMRVLSLTTIGRRSGEERSTPLACFPEPDGSYLVVASAGGARHNPAWYHNLSAAPDRARIEVDGRTVDVVAEQLAGEDRTRAWHEITTAVPRFASYEGKTDREMPVIRLRPRTS